MPSLSDFKEVSTITYEHTLFIFGKALDIKKLYLSDLYLPDDASYAYFYIWDQLLLNTDEDIEKHLGQKQCRMFSDVRVQNPNQFLMDLTMAINKVSDASFYIMLDWYDINVDPLDVAFHERFKIEDTRVFSLK